MQAYDVPSGVDPNPALVAALNTPLVTVSSRPLPNPLNLVAVSWRNVYQTVVDTLIDKLTGPVPPLAPDSENEVAVLWKQKYDEEFTLYTDAIMALNSPLPPHDPSAANVVADAWRSQFVTEQIIAEQRLLSLNGPLFPSMFVDPANHSAQSYLTAYNQVHQQYQDALTEIGNLQSQLASVNLDKQVLLQRSRCAHYRCASNPGQVAGPAFALCFFNGLTKTAPGYGPGQFTVPSRALNLTLSSGLQDLYTGPGVYDTFLGVNCEFGQFGPTGGDPQEYFVEFVLRDTAYNFTYVSFLNPNEDSSADETIGCTVVPLSQSTQPPDTAVNGSEVYIVGGVLLYRSFRIRATASTFYFRMPFHMAVQPSAPGRFGTAESLDPSNQCVWDLFLTPVVSDI